MKTRRHISKFREPKLGPAGNAFLVLLPGEARHFLCNCFFDLRPIVLRNPVGQLVKLPHDFPPEEGALRSDLDGAIGDATQIGDVLLRWLAVDSRALGKDRRPMGVSAVAPSTESPGLTLALLPSNEHQGS